MILTANDFHIVGILLIVFHFNWTFASFPRLCDAKSSHFHRFSAQKSIFLIQLRRANKTFHAMLTAPKLSVGRRVLVSRANLLRSPPTMCALARVKVVAFTRHRHGQRATNFAAFGPNCVQQLANDGQAPPNRPIRYAHVCVCICVGLWLIVLVSATA